MKQSPREPLAGDPLGERLEKLRLPWPTDPSALVAAGTSPHGGKGPAAKALRNRRRRRAGGSGAAILMLLAINLVGAHLFASYDRVLAAVPLVGPVTQAELELSGLTPALLQPQSVTKSLDGITLSIVGSFADANRTTVFVRFASAAQCLSRGGLFGDMYLTDGAGRNFPLLVSDGCPDSSFGVTFSPLPKGELVGSQQLVLHAMVTTQSNRHAFSPGNATGPALEIPFTVAPGADASLDPPPPVTTAGTQYRITGLTMTGSAIDVSTTAQGQLIDQLNACAAIPGGSGSTAAPMPSYCNRSSETYPGIYLIDPSGHRHFPSAGYGGDGPTFLSELAATGVLRQSALFDLSGPGAYRVVFCWQPSFGPEAALPGAKGKYGVIQASWSILVP
ncbi:MAG: hypothetical protein ACYDC5_08820 [Candidatus Dormibacteria bacterium]